MVVVFLGGMTGTAEARRGGGGIVVINTGDDIVHIRDLDPEVGAAIGYTKLGYRYQRFGLFWLDLWRWDGEFVVYEGLTYVPLSDEELASLGGASTPWRYRLPDGFLILAAIAYYFVIGRRKRRVKTAFILAGGFAVTSLAFFIMGLTWEFMIPLAIALHHGLTAYSAMKRGDDKEVEVAAEEPAPPIRPSKPHIAVRPPVATGTPVPSRPSQPLITSRPSQPLVIEKPSAPVIVPVRPDNSVDGPKLLR